MSKRWTAAAMGRKGGKMAKHALTREQAQAMVAARWGKRDTGGDNNCTQDIHEKINIDKMDIDNT
jgi:hypothetical protein